MQRLCSSGRSAGFTTAPQLYKRRLHSGRHIISLHTLNRAHNVVINRRRVGTSAAGVAIKKAWLLYGGA